MEFEGVVLKKLPETKGVSARGEWQRQDVIFEMPQEYNRKVCVTFFNKPTDAAALVEGQTYIVSVNVESREFNGRWYTDVLGRRVEPKEAAQVAQAQYSEPLPTAASAPMAAPMPTEEPAMPAQSAQVVDDLPF